MRRREVIALVAGGAAWPRAADAQQQAATPGVGLLHSASPEGYSPHVAADREGLKEAGFVEGENVLVEYRWAQGHYDRLPALADELVHPGCRDRGNKHPGGGRCESGDGDDPHCVHDGERPGGAGARGWPCAAW